MSRDGGESWRRIVKGLDHKHILYSFDVADDGKTLYLATLGDGVYRSTDAGNSWRSANKGLTNKVIDIVAVAPKRADHVIAAGVTGGLFRSIDGGDSWHEVSGEFGKITAVRFHPEMNDQVYFGDNLGALYQSKDAGATWSLLYRAEAAITALAVTDTPSGIPAILFGTAHGEIVHSNDRSRHFTTEWVFPSQEAVVSIDVASDASNNRTVYATLWDEGVYCSTDDGLNWTICANGLTRDRQSRQLGRPSFSKLAVAISTIDDSILFLAGYDGMFRSRNGGRSWQQIETLSTANIVGVVISRTHDNDSTVFLTNWLWGAHVTGDGGKSWQSMNNGTVDYIRENGVTRLFNIVLSPDYENDRTIYTSTWYRLLKSTDEGHSWRQISIVEDEEWTSKHHGLVIAISPDFRDDGAMYVGTHRGILLKSTDRGETFRVLKNVNNVIGGLVVTPGDAQGKTVFAGDSHGVYRSRDGGKSWDFTQLVDDELHFNIMSSPALPDEVAKNWIADQYSQREKEFGIKLSASPAYTVDRTVFAGTPNGLFMTTDGGESWNHLRSGRLNSDSFVESVAVSPDFANDRTLLVSVRGDGHYRSVDGGQNIVRTGEKLIDDQIFLSHFVGMVPKFPSIVFSPSYAIDRTIYGYSGRVLFRSLDVGNTWERIQAPNPGWFERNYVKGLYRYSRMIPGKWYRSKRIWAVIILTIGVSGFAVFALRKRHRQKTGVPA